ncbi:MAG: translocation/assembly module TamB domain-containing protein, partial [Muribaculaceae bacterium]|nr:translocation/assembly module TamB domain-containing protein [Muribaculaceae bacterium]
LLNNRLRLNGNFGYRDQMLNNNQFIGDFDVEYLLNRGGNWSLKAYNHFNDRNLYVKTAMTTQGLGIVFKHDFDKLRFWRRRSKSKSVKPVEQTGGGERYEDKTHNENSPK